MREQPQNIQSGVPTVESTFDTPRETASAGEDEGVHLEPDPEQGVKVVHQVHPDALPVDSPTDYERQAGAEDTRNIDVRVTPTTSSVHEAAPRPGPGVPE